MNTLLDRFCRYVAIETTSNEDTETYPSSPGQLELGRVLAAELKALGLLDVSQNEHGIVVGTVPGNIHGAPTVAWLAHLDTSPEVSGKAVRPQVIRAYDGRDIVLPADPSRVIRVEDAPQLAGLQGKTLITTDGTTLLGADDKAGIAVIVTAAEGLLRSAVKHGPIRVVFTCDEEIGRGTDRLEVAEIGAVVAYTLDGEAAGVIENETFSADLAVIAIEGRNIHPGLAHGKMVNAIRIAAGLVERLPKDSSPERTQGREPFLHPYRIEGGVEKVEIRILLRTFDGQALAQQAELIRQAARQLEIDWPGSRITVDIRRQYRNMAEYLTKEPRAVDLAVEAHRALGIEPQFHSIRGGTDGSRLSEMGLPTPNLSTGMHNFHSPLEFACLEEMDTAVRVLLELARLWGLEREPTG
ncbi:MAG: peptidase T [Armatimonadetes bacterium]|nr:peptidase T [Armatimonadota bacterium]